MKKGIFSLIAVMILAAIPAHAFDIKDALKKIGSKDSTSTSSGLGSILGNLLSTDKIELKSMVGNWSYSAPAVSFKSDNLCRIRNNYREARAHIQDCGIRQNDTDHCRRQHFQHESTWHHS